MERDSLSERQKMKVRILTAIGIAVFGIPLLIFSDYVIYPIALGLLCAIAAFELMRVFGVHKNWFVSIPTYVMTALLPIVYFLTVPKNAPREEVYGYIVTLFLAVAVYILYLAAVAVFSGGRLPFSTLALTFASVTYITFAFNALAMLRYMPYGAYIYLMVFIGAWTCDTFAYFTGRLFGRHKLAPTLSPKKTVEGSIGGMLFTVGGFALYGFIIECVDKNVEANYLALCLIGLALSVVSQIGDLFASLIKREYGVKDYSRMLPGHGGVMDRFDSILAVSIVLLVLCYFFTPFTFVF